LPGGGHVLGFGAFALADFWEAQTVLLWRDPTIEEVASYLQHAAELPWSYAQIGATRFGPPAGFDHDWAAIEVGRGREAFLAARRAIEDWAMFPCGMSCVYGDAQPLEPGQVVAVLINTGWVKTLGACRIVYRVDELQDQTQRPHPGAPLGRFGFAYGTLTDHIEVGEESFLVTWHADDRVEYAIESFSRPQHWLAKLGYPYVRWQQRRFRRLSTRAMHQAVRARLSGDSPRPQTWRSIHVPNRQPITRTNRYRSAKASAVLR
jgi:uncharacterized protein (UPF0548 family)